MSSPKELRYAKTHEWVKKLEDGTAVIGISDYAQNSLGNLVFVNLPEVGDPVSVGEMFGDVESVKAVSDLLSPVSGEVAEVNEALADEPEKLNDDPYGAWIIKVAAVTAEDELMDADEYDAFCEQEG